MKNPNVLRYGGLAILVIVVAFGVFFFSSSGKQETVTQNQAAPVETKKLPSQATKTFTHEDASFQFDYPEDAVVEKKESTSSAVYANVGITSNQASGNMSFIIEDTKAKTVDDWIKKNLNSTALAEKSVTLGTMEAREITQDSKIIVVAIDQGVLFKLEVMPVNDKDYWDSVYNTVRSTFSIISSKSAAPAESSNVGVASDDVVVEEDIVE